MTWLWPACPPHTTHILQPLDDIPFAWLKTEWKEKLLHLNEATVGQKVNNTTIVSEFPAIFYNAVNRATVKSVFLNMGIWPVDQEQAKKKIKKLKLTMVTHTCSVGAGEGAGSASMATWSALPAAAAEHIFLGWLTCCCCLTCCCWPTCSHCCCCCFLANAS